MQLKFPRPVVEPPPGVFFTLDTGNGSTLQTQTFTRHLKQRLARQANLPSNEYTNLDSCNKLIIVSTTDPKSEAVVKCARSMSNHVAKHYTKREGHTCGTTLACPTTESTIKNIGLQFQMWPHPERTKMIVTINDRCCCGQSTGPPTRHMEYKRTSRQHLEA